MATLRLFATVRVAAGTGRDTFDLDDGATVGDVLDAAIGRYGDEFAALVPVCRIWLNGDTADREAFVNAGDEVALLPPVSGG